MIPMTEMATCISHQQILEVFMFWVQMWASCFNPLLLLHLKLDAQSHFGITWCPLPYLHICILAPIKLWFMFCPWNLRKHPVVLTIWATLLCDPGLPHDCIEYSNHILWSPTKHKQDKIKSASQSWKFSVAGMGPNYRTSRSAQLPKNPRTDINSWTKVWL